MNCLKQLRADALQAEKLLRRGDQVNNGSDLQSSLAEYRRVMAEVKNCFAILFPPFDLEGGGGEERGALGTVAESSSRALAFINTGTGASPDAGASACAALPRLPLSSGPSANPATALGASSTSIPSFSAAAGGVSRYENKGSLHNDIDDIEDDDDDDEAVVGEGEGEGEGGDGKRGGYGDDEKKEDCGDSEYDEDFNDVDWVGVEEDDMPNTACDSEPQTRDQQGSDIIQPSSERCHDGTEIINISDDSTMIMPSVLLPYTMVRQHFYLLCYHAHLQLWAPCFVDCVSINMFAQE